MPCWMQAHTQRDCPRWRSGAADTTTEQHGQGYPQSRTRQEEKVWLLPSSSSALSLLCLLRFGLPKNKLSREFGKYTLFCMEIVENGFEKTQVNDQHVHQISSQLVPWLSFLPLSHPSPTLRSLPIDLYHFCSSAAFCSFQDNI